MASISVEATKMSSNSNSNSNSGDASSSSSSSARRDEEVGMLQRCILGGASSGIALLFTNPIDVVKTRMQLRDRIANNNNNNNTATATATASARAASQPQQRIGAIRVAMNIMREEGFAGYYKGIGAALMRAGTYSSIRIGAYEPLKDAFDPAGKSLSMKILAGCISGGIGSIVANPIEVVKVRLQADKGATPRYRSTAHAFMVLLREEGVKGLFKGMIPHTQRAALLTATQLPSYDVSKRALLYTGFFQDNFFLHLCASMAAGLITTTVSSPFDVMKTRMMTQSGVSDYKGTFDCFVKIYQQEGVRGFFRGWLPNYARLGPQTLLMFVVYEQLRRLVGMKSI